MEYVSQEYDQDKKYKNRGGYRSLFWPMILIGVGTAWLLYNIGIFSSENIAVAFRLWPLFLIIAGADLLFGRRSLATGGTIGLIAVGFVLALMYLGPSIGLGANVEYNNTQFTVENDDVSSLQLNIKAGVDSIHIQPLEDSKDVLFADVDHQGELDYVVEGTSNKVVTVTQKDGDFNFGFMFGNDSQGWNFYANPSIPLAIDYDGGVGSTSLDLSKFYLTDVKLNLGIGEMDIILPEPQESYALDIQGGIGAVNLDVPDDAAIRIIANTGVGGVDMPAFLSEVNSEDHVVGENGTWETPGFDLAEKTITINFDGGVGGMEVK